MQEADIPAAARAAAAGFGLDISAEDGRRRWEQRVGLPLQTDPGGCFVAESNGEVIGAAQAIQRERVWCLSLLAVDPTVQSAGAGRGLMQAAMSYGDTTHGLIPSSNDPRALRLYRLAGFTLLPTFEADGAVDRRSIPRPDPAIQVSAADDGDVEALAPISREIRGAAHTEEIRFALAHGAHLVHAPDRGFALALPGHGVWLLVAREERVATALLWRTLELCGESERPLVRWITGDQGWAIDVVLRAGLALKAHAALAVRGRPGPLHPFLPSGPFA
jgi:ribosomal protein S18 acetylase RimI-like enzyme